MISLKDITRGWNRFFFEPQSPLPIAVFRILFGLVVLANQALLIPEVDDWFSDRGVISFSTGGKLAGGAGFNLFQWLPHTDASVWIVFTITVLAAITMTLGLFTRISTVLLFLTIITLHHRNSLILNSGDTFMRIALFFLIFSQAGAALSLDRLIRIARGKESGAPAPREPWAMRLIQLQLTFIYFYTFIWKAMGAMWLSGTAIYYTSRISDFWRFPVPYIFEHMWTIKLWTWATLLIEFALGVLIWIKELRYWILLAGVMLHLGIEYSMNIPLFAHIMIAAYVTFVEPHHLERAFAWFKTKWNRFTHFQEPVPVLYDAKCSFCNRTLEVVRRLDCFGRLRFYPMHEPATRETFPDFDPARGEKEMLVRTSSGWLGGYFAFRFLSRHLPLFWPLRPFLYLAPVRLAGDRWYQRIAARRYCILSPGN